MHDINPVFILYVIALNDDVITHADAAHAGKEYLREGGRGDRDGSRRAGREDERQRHRQGRPVEEGPRHALLPEHPVDLEETVHARVLARPEVDERVLRTDQAD